MVSHTWKHTLGFHLQSFCLILLLDLLNKLPLAEVYETLIKSLKTSRRMKAFPDFYAQFLVFLKHFYCILGISDPTSGEELIQPCLELASVPWLSTIDPPWFDLKVLFFGKEELFRFHSTLQGYLGSNEVQTNCLELLCFLSRSATCPTWVSHIVRNTMVGCQHFQIR